MARPKKQATGQYGKRAVIYLRVSTDEQAKPGHYGLDAQEASCKSYCERTGYTVLAVKQDIGISGAKEIAKRPGLLEALGMCETGAVDVLVCYDQDRLARKSAVFDAIRDRAVAGRYRLEISKDGQNVAARENEIPAEIKSFVASLERKMIANRLYGGRKERSRRDGRGSGPLPYGYVRHQDGTIAIDQDAASIISTVLRYRTEGKTYQATANAMNMAGYTTPSNGAVWTTSQVQKIEGHAELYKTGVRKWDGVKAELGWPVIFEE